LKKSRHWYQLCWINKELIELKDKKLIFPFSQGKYQKNLFQLFTLSSFWNEEAFILSDNFTEKY